MSDQADIQQMLKNVKGNPTLKKIDYNEEKISPNGYKIKISDSNTFNIGPIEYSLVLIIKKNNFFWRVGLEYSGGKVLQFSEDPNYNWEKLKENLYVVNYHHLKTNGSLDQIKEALADTLQYFPKKRFPRYELNDCRRENAFYIHYLIEEIGKKYGISFRFRQNGFEQNQHFYNQNLPIGDVEKVIAELKQILPSLTVTFYHNENDVGFTLLEKEIPDLLTASTESKTAKKCSAGQHSLKWLTAKSIWHALPSQQVEAHIKNHPELEPVLQNTKKFI